MENPIAPPAQGTMTDDTVKEGGASVGGSIPRIRIGLSGPLTICHQRDKDQIEHSKSASASPCNLSVDAASKFSGVTELERIRRVGSGGAATATGDESEGQRDRALPSLSPSRMHPFSSSL